MNINDIILKSRHYERVGIYRYTTSIDSMGRETKSLSEIGSVIASIQPNSSYSTVKGRGLENSHAGEKIDEGWLMYSPITDIKNKDLVKVGDLFYEVRNIEERKMKQTILANGNILDLSHIKVYLSRSDNQ